MDYQVRLSRSAQLDLQGIVRYISIDDSVHAVRFGKFLLQHTKSLGRFPERGRIVPEIDDECIREIIVRAYRVVYRVNHEQRRIEVIRFWHAGRGNPQIT